MYDREIDKGDLNINFLTQLSSGLTIVSDDTASVGTTALAFFVAVGSRDEKPDQWGMAHLLEHLLFKGAAHLDHRAIARLMDRLGADMNAFTTRDYTCFHAKVLDSEALSAYQLLKDLVRDPWLKAADLEREKGVVREEMKESLDDPDDVVDTLITEALYRDQAYTHDILGTEASLEGITADGLRDFYSAWYRPENMVLAVSGGAREVILKAAQRDFVTPPESSRLPRHRAAPPFALSVYEKPADWEQIKVALGIAAPGRYDPGYAPALMLASILGGQNASRLWQRLREDEGLVYSVGTQYAPETDFGDMITYLSLGPDRMDQALRALFDEVGRLALEGPDGDEMFQTRMYLNTVLVMNQETPDARIMRLGRYALDGRVAPDLTVTADALARVSAELVQAEARRWQEGNPMAAVACGPLTERLWEPWLRQGR